MTRIFCNDLQLQLLYKSINLRIQLLYKSLGTLNPMTGNDLPFENGQAINVSLVRLVEGYSQTHRHTLTKVEEKP